MLWNFLNVFWPSRQPPLSGSIQPLKIKYGLAISQVRMIKMLLAGNFSVQKSAADYPPGNIPASSHVGILLRNYNMADQQFIGVTAGTAR